MMFLGWTNERDTLHLFCIHAAQTEKHLLRTQNVSDKNQKLFCVSDTNFVSATNVTRTGKRGNICVRNNVYATLCPRLPPPLACSISWEQSVGRQVKIKNKPELTNRLVVSHQKGSDKKSYQELTPSCFPKNSRLFHP